jgi:hypothetical protein
MPISNNYNVFPVLPFFQMPTWLYVFCNCIHTKLTTWNTSWLINDTTWFIISINPFPLILNTTRKPWFSMGFTPFGTIHWGGFSYQVIIMGSILIHSDYMRLCTNDTGWFLSWQVVSPSAVGWSWSVRGIP